jgi:hypothetical protein
MHTAMPLLRFCAVFALALAMLLAVYFSAYFALGYRGRITGPYMKGDAQFFRHNWQVSVFWPAAKMESYYRDKPVYIQQWDVPKQSP